MQARRLSQLSRARASILVVARSVVVVMVGVVARTVVAVIVAMVAMIVVVVIVVTVAMIVVVVAMVVVVVAGTDVDTSAPDLNVHLRKG
jgi:hypothetical protein